MNPENKFARILRNSGPARFFVPAGLLIIIVGIILLCMRTDNYIATTGRITSVTEGVYDDESGSTQYDVGFTYTVDGKEYTGEFYNMGGSFAVGDEIKVCYDPEDPTKTSASTVSGIVPPIVIAVGAVAALGGILATVKAFKKSRELDEALPGGRFPTELFDGVKTAPGVREIYVRYDGNTFKPGYIVEDADRKPLFEGKMTKNAMIGARTFEFVDHATGAVSEHEVGHTVTQGMTDEFFSAKSWFKFDGENVWDVLHSRGVRIATDMRSKFPYLVYNVIRDGAAFARIESSSMYVHEEDEAEHKFVVPTGRMFYRVWTAASDMETLFLTVFAISESEQTSVE